MATSTKQQDKLELLRDILLPGEHKALEELSLQVVELEKQGRKNNELLKQLELQLDQKLEEHKKRMEHSMDSAFLKSLKKQIDHNPEAVSELLVPLMPGLLKTHKKERRKARRHSLGSPARSLRRSWRSFRQLFNPVSESEKAEKQIKSLVVEQLLLIDRKSGNLRASFEESSKMDESRISVICGMVNDFIQKHDLGQDQHLAVFTHGPYKIYIQGFIKHFVAMVIPGKKGLECKEKLQDIIFTFYYQFLAANLELLEDSKKETRHRKIINRRFLEKAMDMHFKKESP